MVVFDLIAFDADDTLWHNESLYKMGRDRFHKLLAKYQLQGAIDERLDETEDRNVRYYGYGVMSFVLSLIETAIELTGGQVSGNDIAELISLSKEMLIAEVRLFDGAEVEYRDGASVWVGGRRIKAVYGPQAPPPPPGAPGRPSCGP